MTAKPVLIMAGGTGGHVFPALAVAEYLRDQGIELFWLGTNSGLESRIIPEKHIQFLTIKISGLRGKGLAHLLMFPIILSIAFIQAFKLLTKYRPCVVLGMGGYVSGPGGIAAWLLRIPLLIHEQNSVAGLTNRILSPLARTVMVGFPGTLQGKKMLTTGNPVRRDILDLPLPEQRFMNRGSQPLRLLVLGGSLGARAFNEIIPSMIKQMPERVNIDVLHQTGKQNYNSTKLLYEEHHLDTEKILPFIDDMAQAYEWADVVLCRAGALTVSELSVVGIASILVPYPYAVDDHQTFNARYLSDYDCAILIKQSELNETGLIKVLSEFHDRRIHLLEMANMTRNRSYRDATMDVGDACMRFVNA